MTPEVVRYTETARAGSSSLCGNRLNVHDRWVPVVPSSDGYLAAMQEVANSIDFGGTMALFEMVRDEIAEHLLAAVEETPRLKPRGSEDTT